ncbi:hypothetical protein TspCOW1_29660 [Thiohalobacter sp. COW1]|uniref:hypothetical protein n=1 Tax=Thiohalobacter sp. COW1 TaxID=2795687 RepID=UPI0019169D5F|nr:hypothetical protein [Thiohalobacter sp. COW1]BCO32863.1 hypothetical protein TspCOW1_29660 [Thiohalobacter sp. COW1]
MGRKGKKQPQPKVTWAQAFRDIVIAAMNRGQLLLLMVVAVVIIPVWKMTPEESSRLVFDVLENLKNGSILGYILFVSTVLGWFFHARAMRRIYSNEYRRIGKEKSAIQSKAAGAKFKSSDR